MKFSAVVLGALAAVASALPAFTNSEFDVQEGKPITLTWTGATGPVNLQILTGPNKDSLVPVQTIATGLTGTSFTYTPSGLPSGNYAFKIVDTTTNEDNYGKIFAYTGTGSSSSLVSSTRTTTGSSTRATSSSSTSDASSTTSSAASSSTSSTRSATTTATTTRSTPTTSLTNNNEGQRFGSSLALVFITVAALVFFN